MPFKAALTKKRILDVTIGLLAARPVRGLCLEDVARMAGLTRKSLYAHFPSKDHLVTAALEVIQRKYQRELEELAEAGNFQSVREFLLTRIDRLAERANHPDWKGNLFMRISAELAYLPGHPGHKIISQANWQLEGWFERRLLKEGRPNARQLARQILIMRNGITLTLMQENSAEYVLAAKQALEKILPAQAVYRAVA